MTYVGFLGSITDWILTRGGWFALAIVFLVPALEASAFLGFLFPGEIAVLLGGVLAFHGRVPLPGVIVAAVAGAIVGDTVGYFVGRRFGHRILHGMGRRMPFLRRRIDEHLENAQAYLRRRGGAAIFFGRFTAALRVMVPALAGMAEVPYGQFAFYNAAGGLVWGTTFVLLGYSAGAAWHRIASDASKVGLGLLLLVLIGLVLGRILRGVREHGERIPDRLARIALVTWVRERFPRQSAWLSRRMETDSPRGFQMSAVVVAAAVCGWIFIGLTQDVLAHEEAVLSDPRVTRFVVAHRVAWATALMKSVTWLGSNAVLVPLVVALGGYVLLRKKNWRAVLLLTAALVGASGWYHVVKPIIARQRPPQALHLITVSGYAFPSGHATSSIAVWMTVALVLSRGRPGKLKVAVWIGAGLIATLVAFSRVYLGVHWWTDVVAGTALGGVWFCVLVIFDLLWQPGRPESARPVRRDDRQPIKGDA